MKKKLISLLLAVLMVISLLPVGALAAEAESPEENELYAAEGPVVKEKLSAVDFETIMDNTNKSIDITDKVIDITGAKSWAGSIVSEYKSYASGIKTGLNIANTLLTWMGFIKKGDEHQKSIEELIYDKINDVYDVVKETDAKVQKILNKMDEFLEKYGLNQRTQTAQEGLDKWSKFNQDYIEAMDRYIKVTFRTKMSDAISAWWNDLSSRGGSENANVYDNSKIALYYTTEDTDEGRNEQPVLNPDLHNNAPKGMENAPSIILEPGCLDVTAIVWDIDESHDALEAHIKAKIREALASEEPTSTDNIITVTDNDNAFVKQFTKEVWKGMSAEEQEKALDILYEDAYESLMYRLSFIAVNADTEMVEAIADLFINYCNHLMSNNDGLEKLTQALVYSHGFEGEISDQYKELCSQILVQTGSYATFVMDMIGKSSNVSNERAKEVSQKWLEATEYIDNSMSKFLTGHANYSYITGGLLEFVPLYINSEINVTRKANEKTQRQIESYEVPAFEIGVYDGTAVPYTGGLDKRISSTNGMVHYMTFAGNATDDKTAVGDFIKQVGSFGGNTYATDKSGYDFLANATWNDWLFSWGGPQTLPRDENLSMETQKFDKGHFNGNTRQTRNNSEFPDNRTYAQKIVGDWLSAEGERVNQGTIAALMLVGRVGKDNQWYVAQKGAGVAAFYDAGLYSTSRLSGYRGYTQRYYYTVVSVPLESGTTGTLQKLSNQVKNAPEGKTTTIKLDKNISEPNSKTSIDVPANRKIVLDLNGKSLKFFGNASTGVMFNVAEGAELTIKNGSIYGSSVDGKLTKFLASVSKNATLKMEGVTATDIGMGIDALEGSKVELTSCDIKGNADIYDVDDFVYVMKRISSGAISNVTINLRDDIDLSGINYDEVWSPTSEAAFTGRFYGNKHTISGFTETTAGNGGLFRKVGNKSVYTYFYDLIIKDANVKSTGAATPTGVVAGMAVDDAYVFFTNVTVEGGKVEGKIDVGGLLGKAGADAVLHFDRCVNSAAVNSDQSAGGILAASYAYGYFDECQNKGSVNGKSHAGGILAFSNGRANFESCINDGQITATTYDAGGIGGHVGHTSAYVSYDATNCVNNGNVISTSGNAGGIFGRVYSQNGAKVNYCENHGNITSNGGYAGGIIGSSDDIGSGEAKYNLNKGYISGKKGSSQTVGYSQGNYDDYGCELRGETASSDKISSLTSETTYTKDTVVSLTGDQGVHDVRIKGMMDIYLNGHTLTLDSTRGCSMFSIDDGGGLNIIGPGTIKGDVIIPSDGTFINMREGKYAVTLDKGVVVDGFTIYSDAHSVIPIKSGELKMYDATIQNCKCYGGTVLVDGRNKATAFKMYGGSIRDCRSGDYGGAVSVVNGGRFEMTGGLITKCWASKAGSAVYVSGATSAVSFMGGEISFNHVETDGYGGAVYFTSDSCKSERIFGGTIYIYDNVRGPSQESDVLWHNVGGGNVMTVKNPEYGMKVGFAMTGRDDYGDAGTGSFTIYDKKYGGYDRYFVATNSSLRVVDYCHYDEHYLAIVSKNALNLFPELEERAIEDFSTEELMNMLDAYEMVCQNKEYREKMQEDEAFMQLIDDFKARVKAVNHKVERENYSVSLLGAGANGTDEPDWKVIINSEALEAIPQAIDAKIGEDWRILAAEDITVTRTDDKAVEGKFTIGFSEEDIEKYKNGRAIIYHVLADGTVEELLPTWDEANKCFKVVADSLGQFVLTAKDNPDIPQTGDSSNMMLWLILAVVSCMGICACLVLGKKRKYSK